MDIQDTTAKTGLFGGIKAALFGEKGLFYPGSLKAFKEGWQETEAQRLPPLEDDIYEQDLDDFGIVDDRPFSYADKPDWRMPGLGNVGHPAWEECWGDDA